MSFNGSEGSSITLERAAAMTEKYRDENLGATKAHFFGKTIIAGILAQSDCEGIRIYYGIDADDDLQLVIVGAESNEDDQIGTGHTIADISSPCPTSCGEANVLNGN